MPQGMVISLEMRIIIEMGNRGSKSDIVVYVSVKEQRVDGTGYIFLYLRYTLVASKGVYI
jgi:hypothetical protein